MYSSFVTLNVSSNAISSACPSQIFIHEFVSTCSASTTLSYAILSSADCESNSNDFANNESPASIANGSPHTLCTAGFPLLVSSLSMISSCIRLNVCVNSMAAAAFRAFSGFPPTA